jgi:uncharacterized membrane protein
MTRTQTIACAALALFYSFAGVMHLIAPAPFLAITPPWVPFPAAVIAFTGVAELAGALGIAQWRRPELRRAAGWGLALYALCVWPANFQHLFNDLRSVNGGAGLGYHIPRLAAQPLLIWLTLWASGATSRSAKPAS